MKIGTKIWFVEWSHRHIFMYIKFRHWRCWEANHCKHTFLRRVILFGERNEEKSSYRNSLTMLFRIFSFSFAHETTFRIQLIVVRRHVTVVMLNSRTWYNINTTRRKFEEEQNPHFLFHQLPIVSEDRIVFLFSSCQLFIAVWL